MKLKNITFFATHLVKLGSVVGYAVDLARGQRVAHVGVVGGVLKSVDVKAVPERL